MSCCHLHRWRNFTSRLSGLAGAASCAELDGASHCVCGARPAMPNPDPSLAAELFDLASNDDRPCSQRATDGPSGCVGGGAQRSVADAHVGIDPTTSIAKAPDDLIFAHTSCEIALACCCQLHTLVHEALRPGSLRVAYISSRPLDCRELRFVRCLGDRLAHGKNVRASALRKFCSKLGGMLLSHEVLSVVVLLGLELRAPKRWQPSAPAASHDAARRKRTRLRAWVPSLHRTW